MPDVDATYQSLEEAVEMYKLYADKLGFGVRLPNYTFEYKYVDSVLNAMFWADETDKLYYKEFGDVISFDSTFRTNKYGMIFVPFTAIDNHKCSINIGACLLSNKSSESYRWLLDVVLKPHGKHPQSPKYNFHDI
uniref:MULE transposase domain-containing protein n=1 Tax=Lactuca sativa TaxID=4236 RepID=A0A9R1VH97_LACSA|nr:hypothetical protein LSAT_V11C500243790 [Lactuca sativa]